MTGRSNPSSFAETLLGQAPGLVHRAEALATAMRFDRSSIPEVGRLLAMLTAARPRGRVAEIGTGCGVGSAWIASALGPEAALVSVESDEERAAAAGRLFAEQPNVRILHGDWHVVLPPEAPFDLVFFDGGHWKRGDVPAESEAVLGLVAAGGIVVVDDLTPEELRPEERRDRPDPVRELWLGDPRLRAVEILTTPRTVAILATKTAD
jgi:predicted O-methyltransferase YrrM